MAKRKRDERDGSSVGRDPPKLQKLQLQTSKSPAETKALSSEQDNKSTVVPVHHGEGEEAKLARRNAKRETKALKNTLKNASVFTVGDQKIETTSQKPPIAHGELSSRKDTLGQRLEAKEPSHATGHTSDETNEPFSQARQNLPRTERKSPRKAQREGHKAENQKRDANSVHNSPLISKHRQKSSTAVEKPLVQAIDDRTKDNGDATLLNTGHSQPVRSEDNALSVVKQENMPAAAERKKKSGKRKGKSGQGQEKRSKHKHRYDTNPSWRVSRPIGGQMLDADPIFSKNQKYLLIAYHTYVAVYATSTSLLVCSLQKFQGDYIAGFSLSPSHDEQLYIARCSGTIELWDWMENTTINQWRMSSKLHSIVATSQSVDGKAEDLIITVDKKGDGPWLLSAHRLGLSGDVTKTEVKTLLKYKQPLSFAKVLDGGKSIVATSGSQLILGSTKGSNVSKLHDLNYTWNIIECPEWITSIDVRVRSLDDHNRTKQLAKRPPAGTIDIVTGGLKGSIYVYEDLARKLLRREKASSKQNLEDIIARHLHWHRNAVLAVKWSFDGNYIVSGGQETVLILWQLETGKKEALPHLGAPIESLVISPTGSSYGIRLADNSAMILSTSELQPSFSVSGIQSSAADNVQSHVPFTPTVDSRFRNTRNLVQSPPPASAASSMPGQMILAVPPSRVSKYTSGTSLSASYLQTVDVASAQQTSRQALTRTKVTHLNMGPESNTIAEPNVTHMSTSHDGNWLATVDEWMPPKSDITTLAFDPESIRDEQLFRQEIYLKLWKWNETSRNWELVSRIDKPHASASGNPYESGRVLGIIADPNSIAFATVGEDATIRTWKPSVRRRHGLEVKGKDGISLTAWHCHLAVPIEMPDFDTPDNAPYGAKIAYSTDGSILAAAFQAPAPRPIHLIATDTGELINTHTGLYSGPLLGIGILNRYLITLSHTLNIWDMVSSRLHHTVSLPLATFSLPKLTLSAHLALKPQHNIFAITVPEIGTAALGTTKVKARITMFDPAVPEPMFTSQLPNTITTLLPAPGKTKGFYALDSAAELRTIMPSQGLSTAITTRHPDEHVQQKGLSNIFSLNPSAESETKQLGPLGRTFDALPQRTADADDDDIVVVSQDRLAEVFEAPATALPPVTELFEQVVRLYAGLRVA